MTFDRFWQSLQKNSHHLGDGLLVLIVILVSFFHLWQLQDLPRGLYVDETSIGLNAARIAEKGVDEFNEPYPIYFTAFGEYKNPVYIYAAAGLFELFGVSELTLRITSFIFFYLFLLALFLLISELFKGSRLILSYALIAAGFLPWFFPMSRIAFEVISQLTFVVLTLYLIFKAYQKRSRHELLYAFLAGLAAGVSIYTYSTARLLTLGLIGTLLVVYWAKPFWQRHLATLVGFLIGLIPYFIFSANHPGALTHRFKELTFLFNQSMTFWEKLLTFKDNYLSYLSVDYLLLQGDGNLRHAAGHGGELFFVVWLLGILGVVWLIMEGHILKQKYLLFLGLNFLIAPVGAALTTGDSALRSVLIGLYFVIFSCVGLSYLLTLESSKQRHLIVALVLVGLVVESSSYINYYFTKFPEKSSWTFENYNYREVLAEALRQRPKDIIISEWGHRPSTDLAFYRYIVPNPLNTPIRVGEPRAQSGRCIINNPFNETILDKDLYPVRNLSVPGNFTKLNCYY